MFFPISHVHISPIYLVVVGFLIGVLGGFFGVGGSFIAGPALRLVGVDWNFAVGHRSSPHRRQICGGGETSPRARQCRSAARIDHGARHHRRRGNGRAIDSSV